MHLLTLFLSADMELGVQEKLRLQPTTACVVLVLPIMLKLEVSEASRWDFLIGYGVLIRNKMSLILFN